MKPSSTRGAAAAPKPVRNLAAPARPLRRASALVALLVAACAPTPAPARATHAAPAVRVGIETFLADVPAALRGKRVGLITNHSGIDRSRNSDIDLIAR